MEAQPHKLTFLVARKVLGLPEHFDAITADDYREMLNRWKVLVVAAREAGEIEQETELNNVKAWVLAKLKQTDATKCPDCGKAKSRRAQRCGVCSLATRYGHGRMDNAGIVNVLKLEKAGLERQRDTAVARLGQLDAAIAVLEGRVIK